jgi:hypothetical protein
MKELNFERMEEVKAGSWFSGFGDCLENAYGSHIGAMITSFGSIGSAAMALGSATFGPALVLAGGFFAGITILGCAGY